MLMASAVLISEFRLNAELFPASACFAGSSNSGTQLTLDRGACLGSVAGGCKLLVYTDFIDGPISREASCHGPLTCHRNLLAAHATGHAEVAAVGNGQRGSTEENICSLILSTTQLL